MRGVGGEIPLARDEARSLSLEAALRPRQNVVKLHLAAILDLFQGHGMRSASRHARWIKIDVVPGVIGHWDPKPASRVQERAELVWLIAESV
jgi:hypothetical protein